MDMLSDPTFNEAARWFLPAALLAGAGVLAGLIAGLLGVGGGIVVVPVLFQVFGLIDMDPAVRMHAAVGTSLATIIPTGFSSARAHWKRGALDATVLRQWGLWLVLGVFAGSALAAHLEGRVLTLLFGALALSVALRLLLGGKDRAIRDRLPPAPYSQLIAGAIGLVSALLGIGGGTFSVPVLTLCGRSIHRAIGTAAALGLMIALPGALGFMIGGWDVAGRPPLSVGYVNLLGLACIVPTSVLAAPWGARLAHHLQPEHLRRAFALFLLLVAGRMIFSGFL
ncbi:sulfite exporter TauE/SafE family protein [Magnetospira thiophila]